MTEFRSNTRRRFYEDCLRTVPFGLSPLERRISDVDIGPFGHGPGSASTRAASSGVVQSGPKLPKPAIDVEVTDERAEPKLLWADLNVAGVVMRSALALAPFFGLCLIFIMR